MSDLPIAEWLPERYRNVLDRISDLEASGRHAAADRVRRDAIRAYSRTWTGRTAARLDRLATRAERLLVVPPAPARRQRRGFIALAASRLHVARRAGVEAAAPLQAPFTPERPTA